jgi:threonine aldolase
MLGGGMRQAGVIAAAGLVALEHGPKRLHIDHENAELLARGLSAIPGIRLDSTQIQTNIVIYDIRETKMTSTEFLERTAQHHVLGVPVDTERVRMVTHLDVDRSEIEIAVRNIGEALRV